MSHVSMKMQIEREVEYLETAPERLHRQLEDLFQEQHNKDVMPVSPATGTRLLKLYAWMTIYKVSLEYLVNQTADQYLHQIGSLHRKTKRAVGFRLTNLVGQNAERLLKESIARDFPDDEHTAIWRWQRIQEIITQRTEDEFEGRTKNLIDYMSVGQYVRSYRSRADSKRRQFITEMSKPSNKVRAYRDNPFLA